MRRRRVMLILAVAWAAGSFAIAAAGLRSVDRDGWALVVTASVLGPAAAAAAAWCITMGRDRLAGVLLLVSVGTPTYFAYPLNVIPLVVGLMLLLSPVRTLE